MSKRDSFIILGLAVALTYANLLGPQRLINQIFPGGTFAGTVLASRLIAKVAGPGPAARPKPAVETVAKTKTPTALPAPVRAAQPRPIAKPAL